MDTELLKALADENRLRIVELLADGEKCICEIAAALDASDALASHHVKQLREAGIVRTRRVGRWLHCSLEPEALTRLAGSFANLAGRAGAAAAGTGCACDAPGEES
ncbi:MAG: metalloregulator ArsR/SmtB family transcription factor [Actinomycetota bacterium]|nr:metalloregulator ArsR/SmtB family transcription factor [Actinomycetota bacterium]